MSMTGGILVPLDGSPFAENAMTAALTLARVRQVPLHLVRVHCQLPLWEAGADVITFTPEKEQEVLLAETEYLAAVEARVRLQGLDVSSEVLKGEIVPAIRDYAAHHGVDLVVMTSHGWSGIRRAMLGSVADYMVRSTTIPVLVVTPRMVGRAGEAWPRRILVPLDGSELAASILHQVRALDPQRHSRICLTSVIQLAPATLVPWACVPEVMVDHPEQREERAREYLEAIADRLRTDGFDVVIRTRSGSRVAREILRVAEQELCDLVALATHGAGGLDRIMFGSVADQLVRHAQVPVLVVRPEPVPAGKISPQQDHMVQAGAA